MSARKIIEQAGKIPAVSQAALKLLDLLNQPDIHNDELVRAIRLDPVITAQLLRVCNSVFFASHDPIDSTEQAILRLGQQEILRLVLALNFGTSLVKPIQGYAIKARELWQHSLISAFAAENLAQENESLNIVPSVAFTAGLLHDFGKNVLDYALVPDVQKQIRAIIREKNCSRIEGEQTILQTNHCEVASELFTTWRLPSEIIEAVACHHRPVFKPRPKLSTLVHIANCMAHMMGCAPGWDAYAIRAEEDAALALGINAYNLDQCLIGIHEDLQQVQQFLSIV
jgi:putative nucleotidyltransferase with HDIG domain